MADDPLFGVGLSPTGTIIVLGFCARDALMRAIFSSLSFAFTAGLLETCLFSSEQGLSGLNILSLYHLWHFLSIGGGAVRFQ